jgi:hypothetical protein
MAAFNRRLQPKEIFGIPIIAAIGLTVFLVFFVLTLMLPWTVKFFTFLVAIVSFFVAVRAFIMGDELQFLNVMRLGRLVENNCVTSETRTED